MRGVVFVIFGYGWYYKRNRTIFYRYIDVCIGKTKTAHKEGNYMEIRLDAIVNEIFHLTGTLRTTNILLGIIAATLVIQLIINFRKK